MNTNTVINSLAGKRVLVTGGSGFIASHLVQKLVTLGSDVAITTKYDSIVDNIRLINVWDDITVVEADLRNLDSTRHLHDFKPHVIFHMAAYNHVGDSFVHMSEALDSNAKGTMNLLQACDGFDRFVYTSTSEVYGYQTDVPFVETMSPNPISPYSIGKYSGELLARMMMSQMNRPIVVVRPFNAFGPYQSTRAIIAEIILKCLSGQTVRATAGVQTREFNFVDNLVDGMILSAVTDAAIGQIINIGSGEEIAIRDLIRLIHRETTSSSELRIGDLEDRPTEIWRMCADNKKARDIIGWTPNISFETGLRITIDWYREFAKEIASGSGLSRLAAYRTFIESAS